MRYLITIFSSIIFISFVASAQNNTKKEKKDFYSEQKNINGDYVCQNITYKDGEDYGTVVLSVKNPKAITKVKNGKTNWEKIVLKDYGYNVYREIGGRSSYDGIMLVVRHKSEPSINISFMYPFTGKFVLNLMASGNCNRIG